MNRISEVKQGKILEALLRGMSVRAAAKYAGVAKQTVFRCLNLQGGREVFREQGAKFKQNRWK